MVEKRDMWAELTRIKQEKTGNWLIFGDFNVVRRRDEQFRSQFCPYSASDFNEFIHDTGFCDFRMGGERFTYMSRVDAKLSKLDRFLACPNFITAFPSCAAVAHPREISDHSPITLSSFSKDFGPPPFKFYNSWLLLDDLDEVVQRAWGEFSGGGNPDVYLAAK